MKNKLQNYFPMIRTKGQVLEEIRNSPEMWKTFCGWEEKYRRGLSGLHWVWCIGRGPHLQLRQEPQGTSDFRLRSQGPCRLGTGESGLVLG